MMGRGSSGSAPRCSLRKRAGTGDTVQPCLEVSAMTAALTLSDPSPNTSDARLANNYHS